MTDNLLPAEFGKARPGTQDALSIECGTVLGMLDGYTGGELEPETQARIESHVATCPTCAANVSDYLEVIRLAGWLPAIQPPPAVERRLRLLISQELKKQAPVDSSMIETLPDRPGI